MDDSDVYYQAMVECARRYFFMYQPHATENDSLLNFIEDFIGGCHRKLPVTKLCRWLGYIQGVLIERGHTTVEAERNWTRPLFRPLDFPNE